MTKQNVNYFIIFAYILIYVNNITIITDFLIRYLSIMLTFVP